VAAFYAHRGTIMTAAAARARLWARAASRRRLECSSFCARHFFLPPTTDYVGVPLCPRRSSAFAPPPPLPHRVCHRSGRVSCVLSPMYYPIRASTTTLWPTPGTAAVTSSPSSLFPLPDGGQQAWSTTIDCLARRRVGQGLRMVEWFCLRLIALVRPHYWRVLVGRVVAGETTCAGVE